MKYRKMGKLGWDVSVLGFGAMRLPTHEKEGNLVINEAESIEMIRYAIDHGVNYVDTAWYYHSEQSEIVVGKALRDGYREKVKLVTKLPIQLMEKPQDFETFLNKQLEKLQTSYVDIYLFHALNTKEFERVKALNLIPRMERAKKEGKIKHIGFSFHDNFDKFKEIIDYYEWDVCQIQYNYLDYETQATYKGLDYAANRDIAVIIMEPIKGGTLAKESAEIKTLLSNAPHQRTMADWALQYVWNNPKVSVALSGMGNLQMVKENIASAEQAQPDQLTALDLQFLDKLGRRLKTKSLVPCTSCEYCIPCPASVFIPQNFRIINNAFWDDDLDHFRQEYAKLAQNSEELDEKNQNGAASLCVECNDCLEKCPQHINIPWYLKKIANVYDADQSLEAEFQMKVRGPNYQKLEEMAVVGVEFVGRMEGAKIKETWDHYFVHTNEISNKVPWVAYGVQYTDEHGFHYLASAKVSKIEQVPAGMVSYVIPPHEYAIFTFVGNINQLGESYQFIQQDFIANHPKLSIDTQHPWIELYGPRFTPGSEESEIDLYIPINIQK